MTARELLESVDEDLKQEALQGAKKAYFAYHADEREGGAHAYWRDGRFATCCWCGRQRFEVRHDNLPAKCQERPDDWPPDVENVIRGEEEKAFELLEEAQDEIPEMVDCEPEELDGARIAKLQHTHGYQPVTVESALGFEMSKQQRREYEDEMQRHREASR